MPVKLIRTAPHQRRKQTCLVRVSGQAQTFAEIAARMGVNQDTARARVFSLRRHNRTVTWAALGVPDPD